MRQCWAMLGHEHAKCPQATSLLTREPETPSRSRGSSFPATLEIIASKTPGLEEEIVLNVIPSFTRRSEAFGAKSNDHSNHVCLRLLKVYTFLLINSKGSFIITAAICYFVSNILAYQSENYTLVLIKVLLAKRVSLQTVQLLLAHLHVAPFTFTFNSILVHVRRFPLIFSASL